MMDAGAYTINMARLLSGAEPLVESAQASMRPGSKVGQVAIIFVKFIL